MILLDMVMPGGIDGTETYRRVSLHRPGQRALVLSGYATSDRVDEALELGVGAFVRKPLDLRDLAIAVRRELDREVG